jgi:hypothetical protein
MAKGEFCRFNLFMELVLWGGVVVVVFVMMGALVSSGSIVRFAAVFATDSDSIRILIPPFVDAPQ